MADTRIYLDHAATTPLLPAAREAMAEALERWHNPSSPHAEGRAAKATLEEARSRIAAALGWTGKVIFTSGASEAIALALGRAKGGTRLVSAVEHDSVFRAAPRAVRLSVLSDGHLDPEQLGPALRRAERPVVAAQHVNSETGVVQPLGEIAPAVRAAGGILFADCAQSAGKLPLPEADMIAVSAHKLGGPPGVGALLVCDLALLDATGGQEFGYRGGTENLPAILGFAAALDDVAPASDGIPDWIRAHIRHRFELDMTVEEQGGCAICGPSLRSPLIASYLMPGLSAAAQLVRFDLLGFSVSAGSACSSGSMKPSHVMDALFVSPEEAANVIRVSFGRSTTRDEVARFGEAWRSVAQEARVRAA